MLVCFPDLEAGNSGASIDHRAARGDGGGSALYQALRCHSSGVPTLEAGEKIVPEREEDEDHVGIGLCSRAAPRS